MLNIGPLPFAIPAQKLPFSNFSVQAQNIVQQRVDAPPETNLMRVVQYPADYSGCGLYRMSTPAHLLNFHQKAMVQESTVMIADPNWYANVKVVRVQRQATPHQLSFIKFLKDVQKHHKFKIVYEVDDIVFREDIPEYNKFKFAFMPDEIRNSSQQIMEMCDEITTTNRFIADYYSSKLNKKEVTVVPNFPPRWWIGNYFSESKVSQNFDKHKKRPRILYSGSGAHFDVDNRVGQKDDFEHVIDVIIKTRFMYRWVFIGAYPFRLKPYIDNGDLEFHPWQKLYDYPKKIAELEIQMMVAPLQKNTFNNAKSDLKYIEACCYGLPVACQDMITYQDAELKFNTGDEMIDLIKSEMTHVGRYKNQAIQRRKVAEDRYLELDKNIDCYYELFAYNYGDSRRVNLKRYN